MSDSQISSSSAHCRPPRDNVGVYVCLIFSTLVGCLRVLSFHCTKILRLPVRPGVLLRVYTGTCWQEECQGSSTTPLCKSVRIRSVMITMVISLKLYVSSLNGHMWPAGERTC